MKRRELAGAWALLFVIAGVTGAGCPKRKPLPATAMPDGTPEVRADYLVAVALARSRNGEDDGAREALDAAFAELPELGSLEHPIRVRRVDDEYRLLSHLTCAEGRKTRILFGSGFWDVHKNEVTFVEGSRPIDVLHVRCSRDRTLERVLHFEFISEFDRRGPAP